MCLFLSQYLHTKNTLSNTHTHSLSPLLFSLFHFHFHFQVAINIKSLSRRTAIPRFQPQYSIQTKHTNKQLYLRRRLPMAVSASDVEAMYSLLANSMIADHSLRGPAEEALAQSESRPGFCSCLLVLPLSLSLSLRVLNDELRIVFLLCFVLLCFGLFAFGEMETQEVITAKDLAPLVDVRLMATVYFKNCINRYWRHRRDSS